MVSLEQVQLLESRVAKAIDYVRKIKEENAALSNERVNLIEKLDSSQKRLGELELLVMRFKDDQGRIEDGIISALDRLSQFEEAFEHSLTSGSKSSAKKTAAKKERNVQAEETEEKEFFEISEDDTDKNAKEGELDIF